MFVASMVEIAWFRALLFWRLFFTTLFGGHFKTLLHEIEKNDQNLFRSSPSPYLSLSRYAPYFCVYFLPAHLETEYTTCINEALRRYHYNLDLRGSKRQYVYRILAAQERSLPDQTRLRPRPPYLPVKPRESAPEKWITTVQQTWLRTRNHHNNHHLSS